MTIDNSFHIGHGTVAYLDSISIKELSKFVSLWKMPINKFQKLLCNFCLNIFAEWGIVPNNLSLTIFPTLSSTLLR